LTVKFLEDHDIIEFSPNNFVIIGSSSENRTKNVNLLALNPGHAEVTVNITPSDIVDDSNIFIRVIVANSSAIILLSLTVGWVYFAAWSISFYPQIWYNFKRKSVVGLNFDFLALNLLGHTVYAIFNCSLYWIEAVENEYFARHPRGLNPVELNDVVFSIHASIITAFTIGQCFFYEVKSIKTLIRLFNLTPKS
jgi:cystinosin